jgi:hypothetical protein
MPTQPLAKLSGYRTSAVARLLAGKLAPTAQSSVLPNLADQKGGTSFVGLFHLPRLFKNFKGQLLTMRPGRQLQHALAASPQPLCIARS